MRSGDFEQKTCFDAGKIGFFHCAAKENYKIFIFFIFRISRISSRNPILAADCRNRSSEAPGIEPQITQPRNAPMNH